MENGYIENGFIIDLTHAAKTSTIIYELSRILDMQEAKGKEICLKLGAVDLSENELNSIKTLVELMESSLACISTNSEKTLESAEKLEIKISEFTNEISAPSFVNDNPEVEKALNHIFGENETVSSTETINTEAVDESEEDGEETQVQAVEEAPQVSEQDIKTFRTEIENLPTLYLNRTVRSGQSISSDGNILIIGDVNPGAEIIAKGDVTVWGILGGIAHAGSEGNNYARIRALKLNPVQVRIGSIFARRPDMENVPFIQKSSEYMPEEAFVYNGAILIKKIHEN